MEAGGPKGHKYGGLGVSGFGCLNSRSGSGFFRLKRPDLNFCLTLPSSAKTLPSTTETIFFVGSLSFLDACKTGAHKNHGFGSYW